MVLNQVTQPKQQEASETPNHHPILKSLFFYLDGLMTVELSATGYLEPFISVEPARMFPCHVDKGSSFALLATLNILTASFLACSRRPFYSILPTYTSSFRRSICVAVVAQAALECLRRP